MVNGTSFPVFPSLIAFARSVSVFCSSLEPKEKIKETRGNGHSSVLPIFAFSRRRWHFFSYSLTLSLYVLICLFIYNFIALSLCLFYIKFKKLAIFLAVADEETTETQQSYEERRHEFPGMVNLAALDDHCTVHLDGFTKLGLVCLCKFYRWGHFLFLLLGWKLKCKSTHMGLIIELIFYRVLRKYVRWIAVVELTISKMVAQLL